MFKKKILRVELEDKTFKTILVNSDSTTELIKKTLVSKLSSIKDPSSYGLFLKTSVFKRFLDPEEKPLVLAETLSEKNPKLRLANLGFEKKETNNIVLNLLPFGESEIMEVVVPQNSKVSDILLKIVMSGKTSSIEDTGLFQKFQNEKLIKLNSEKKIFKILKNWKKQAEQYQLIFQNLGNINIPGMNKFFEEYESLEIEEEPFNDFNRRIMDIVVAGNKLYLKKEGFTDDIQGNIELANDNMGVLTRLKEDMETEGSKFNIYLERIEQMINKIIEQYLSIVVPSTAKLIGIKNISSNENDVAKLSECWNKIINKHNQEKQLEYTRLIKDLEALQSIKDAKIQGGIGDLIKQDLGVYFFTTKNDLEIMSIDPFKEKSGGISFCTNPIKQGFLDVKTSMLTRKSSSYFVLTPKFLYIFTNPKSKQNLSEIVSTAKSKESLSLNIIKIERSVVEHSEKEISKGNESSEVTDESSLKFTFDLVFSDKTFHITASNQEEMQEWIRLINLMQSRITKQKPIGVHKINQNVNYLYEIKFLNEQSKDNKINQNESEFIQRSNKRPNTIKRRNTRYKFQNIESNWHNEKRYIFEIKSFHNTWKMKKSLLEFNLWIEGLKNELSNIIIPDFPKSFKLQHFSYQISENTNKENEKLNNNSKSNDQDLDNNRNPKINQIKKKSKLSKIKLINTRKTEKKIKVSQNIIQIGKEFISACINELLMNYQINQNIDTLDFFGINNIFQAIFNQNLEQVNYIAQNDLMSLEFTDNGLKPLHYAASTTLEIVKTLIDNGANVNSTDKKGYGILIYSIKDNNWELFNYLIELKSIKIDQPDNKGITPFLHTVIKRNFKFTTSLLEKGIDINHQDNSSNYAASHITFNNSDFQILKLLVTRNIDLNLQDLYNRSLLHLSVAKNNFEIVKYLLESSAKNDNKLNLNTIDNNGKTPLYIACEKIFLPIAELLLDYKADPNIPNNEQKTPLHISISNNNEELAELLLKHNANPNLINGKGMNGLHEAINTQNLKLVSIVSKSKKNIKHDLQSKNGYYPIHFAISNNSAEILQFLIDELKVNLNSKTLEGQTALHLVCKISNIQLLEILLESGAEPEITDLTHQEEMPLHIATRIGDLGVLRTLLKKANINSIRKDGKTSLHIAAQNGLENVVSVLADHGADVNLQDKEGNTPLHMALKNGNDRVATIIVQYGAFLKVINNKGQSALECAKNKKVRKMIKEASDRATSLGSSKPRPSYQQNIRSKNQYSSSIENTQFSQKIIQKLQNLQRSTSLKDNQKQPDFFKITYHTNHLDNRNSTLSVMIKKTKTEVESIIELFNYAKMKIGFTMDLEKYQLLYKDNNSDFVIINNLNTTKELFQFGQSLHIISKEIYQKMFDL
ncbi:no mechanoreceptor potential c isoform d-related [Anaeramoeba flamelloides]|uniref:No mechanoreceptor potential c isoform d-related n=1 Tax=Anaeramoeba flamelloides TaxID=1746091 RepID=A0AAV8AE82_9EUKA|nr:no mechanoreceptor potential c isoform d-related [Anaeramoeba flamelloides]